MQPPRDSSQLPLLTASICDGSNVGISLVLVGIFAFIGILLKGG